MDVNFKFAIGDLVYTKGAVAHSMSMARIGEVSSPIELIVCERIRQECPGGVQLKYLVGDQHWQFLEEELCPVSDFDVEKFFAAFQVGKRRREEISFAAFKEAHDRK